MKRILIIAVSACFAFGAFAQEAPTRALSKYANDSFGKDD